MVAREENLGQKELAEKQLESIEKFIELAEKISSGILTKGEIEVLTKEEINLFREIIGSVESIRELAKIHKDNPDAIKGWISIHKFILSLKSMGKVAGWIGDGLKRILMWSIGAFALFYAIKSGTGPADWLKILGLIK